MMVPTAEATCSRVPLSFGWLKYRKLGNDRSEELIHVLHGLAIEDVDDVL